jgi:hypothetical protein
MHPQLGESTVQHDTPRSGDQLGVVGVEDNGGVIRGCRESLCAGWMSCVLWCGWCDILRESGMGVVGTETVRPSNRFLIPLEMRCWAKNPGLVLSPTARHPCKI